MDNRKRNILLGVLIVGVISMTVAFAALSTTLNISGTASLPTTKWDIHFANGQDNTPQTHLDGKTNKGKITGLQFAATSITNFTATLYQPNDEVVYNFDIVNEGTIDGQLDNFNKTITCNSSNCDMITYTITCEDATHNDANTDDYILASGQSVSCEMKIKYNDQTNTGNGVYTQSAVNMTAGATWLYKQVEGNSSQGGNSGGSEQGGGNENNYTPYTYYKENGKGQSTLDPNWNVYAKITNSEAVASTDIYEMYFQNMHSSDFEITFTSLEECQENAPNMGVTADTCVLLYPQGSTYTVATNKEICLRESQYDPFCLSVSDLNNKNATIQKVKNYFGYDENTWTKVRDNSSYETWQSPDESKACEVDHSIDKFSCGFSTQIYLEITDDIFFHDRKSDTSSSCEIQRDGQIICTYYHS